MSDSKPHYLLFTDCDESCVADSPTITDDSAVSGGRWRFVVESVDGEETVDVADFEPDTGGERLELLAVVRGLESLDQPTRITLVTASRYVNRGIRFGLEEWRASDWKWERHGWMVTIKNADLWQRVDRAMQIHSVQCRHWRFDQPHAVKSPHRVPNAETATENRAASHGLPANGAPKGVAARSMVRALKSAVDVTRRVAQSQSEKSATNWSLAH